MSLPIVGSEAWWLRRGSADPCRILAGDWAPRRSRSRGMGRSRAAKRRSPVPTVATAAGSLWRRRSGRSSLKRRLEKDHLRDPRASRVAVRPLVLHGDLFRPRAARALPSVEQQARGAIEQLRRQRVDEAMSDAKHRGPLRDRRGAPNPRTAARRRTHPHSAQARAAIAPPYSPWRRPWSRDRMANRKRARGGTSPRRERAAVFGAFATISSRLERIGSSVPA